MFPQGDGGNLRALEHRARGRGIDVETVPAPIGDPLPEADLYLLQGAEDEDQPVVARRLREDGTLARAAAAGKVVVGIGAGYEILGKSFEPPEGTTTEGLGLLDVRTTLGEHVDRPRRHEAVPDSACPRSSGTSGTAAAPRSAPGRSRSPRSRWASATAASRRPTAPSRATSSARTSTGRCCPQSRADRPAPRLDARGELEPLQSEFAEQARQERIAEAREIERRKRGFLGRFR